jgi:hypothetical protein
LSIKVSWWQHVLRCFLFVGAYYELIGQPPGKNNRKTAELANVSQQIVDTVNTHRPMLSDWEQALNAIVQRVKGGHCILMIDEINWFGKTAKRNRMPAWEQLSYALIAGGSPLYL